VQAWRGAVFNIGGSRDVSRSEYVTSEAGDDIHKTLSLKLSQDLGPLAGLSLTALSDMVSVFYDDKQANPKDRDMLSNRVNLNVNYKPLGVISTRLGGQYSVEKSVYVRSESSANNRTTRKYVVSGGYDFETIYRIQVKQDYDIGAVYTFYHYGESRNTLVRNSNVQTQFRIPVAKRINLRLNHNYKFQDQGSYREETNQRLYGKSGERESHVLTIGLSYNIIKSLGVIINQTYFEQRNWKYVEGKKELDYETKSTEITGRLRFEYKFGERSRVALSVEQRRKEGDRVGEAFRKYRNIEFEASHVF